MRRVVFLLSCWPCARCRSRRRRRRRRGRPSTSISSTPKADRRRFSCRRQGRRCSSTPATAGERDLNRILEVLKVAGVKQIDHFWLTHYHGDHYGSLLEIAKQVPIKHLYDHGPSIEGDRPNIIKFQAAYAEFYKDGPADDREARRQDGVHRHRHHGGHERQRSAEDADRQGAGRRPAESALRGPQGAR